ncbi:calmodulin-like protein 3 [Asparagus officinalis]|uniref:calmodulin-like protein 3 n=1 Tax=Asparagus officinalis TaxID=4686 RepID=UPI00098E52B2|nr:calmodulin-like protein 3 [Asparagus officinalis]
MAPLIIYTLLFLFTLLSSSLLIKSKKPSPPPATTRPPPMMIEIENGRKSDLETVFSSFDSNGDGLITFQELLDSLTRLRLSVTPDDVRSMMEKVDLNEDGLIDVEEFRVVYDSLLLMDGEGSLMRDHHRLISYPPAIGIWMTLDMYSDPHLKKVTS